MEKNSAHDLIEDGFRFFGTMSASATHELKNTLAIINENIGLMDDLFLMAKDGMISIEQVSSVSKNIKKQVKRSNLILQRLNRFSHSVDLADQVVDIEETVGFTLELASRLIDMYQVSVEVNPAPSSMSIRGNRFLIENMIWKAVETACKGAVEEKKVIISFQQDRESVTVWFSMDNIEDGFMDKLFTTDEEKVLMAYLGIALEKSLENSRFGLVWSHSV